MRPVAHELEHLGDNVETIDPNEDFIRNNWEKTLKIIEPYEKLSDLIKKLDIRYYLSPASPKKDFHAAFPGGLAYHNLHVLGWLGKFAKIMTPGRYNKETLVKVGILHDLGKCGDFDHDYYKSVESGSRWHQERGIFYETNKKIQYMRIPHRSLFLAQEYNIPLSKEEYLAIMLHDGQYDEANRNYSHKEPDLAMVLHFADLWASKIEKQTKIKGW